MSRFGYYMVCFILVSCSVLAVGDEYSSDFQVSGSGLVLTFPKQQAYFVDLSAIELKFGVFDAAGLVHYGNDTHCYGSVYSTNGSTVLEQRLKVVGIEYVLLLNSSVFDMNTSRRVPYNVYCNTSVSNEQVAGFVSGHFELSNSGRLDTLDNKLILWFVAALPLIAGLIFLLGAFLFQGEHTILKPFLYVLCCFSVFGSSWLSIEVIYKYYDFPLLVDNLATFLWVVGMIEALLLCYFLIYLWKVSVDMIKERNKARLEY